MTPWRAPRHDAPSKPVRVLQSGLLALLLLACLAPLGHASSSSRSDTSTGGDNTTPGKDTVTFDRSLLSGGGRNTDNLARFEGKQVILPGEYNVDLYVNGVPDGRTTVRFAARPGHAGDVMACFTPDLLQQVRLEPRVTEALRSRMADPKDCVTIGDMLDGARDQLDLGELRLDISVPQASMSLLPRGYVAPENLTSGVNAGLLNYSFNGYRSRTQGITRTSAYMNLATGVNLGRWRLRHTSSLLWQSGFSGQPAQHNWQNIESYAQRDLPTLDAQLTIGDTYTDGDLFDSVALRGVQVATDERMLPSSLRGYAPVIRGVARTNAKVTVRQNGVLLYQTTVAPGPFAIRDLYPTGYGGDLDVEVSEADGDVRRFSVPYASVAQLLRPGATRFELATGTLRNPSLVHKQMVTEGILRHGINNLLTGYGGAVGARGYFAYQLGGAVNSRWGAIAIDATSARTKIPGVETISGRSYRLSYSKILPDSDTSISVAAYRYSTSGYLGLNDAMLARDYARRGLQVFATAPPTSTNASQNTFTGSPVLSPGASIVTQYTGGIDRPRNRFSLTLNQRLGTSAGSLFLNAWTRDYWNRSQHDTQYQIGYNNRFHGVGLNVTATRSRDMLGRNDTQLYVSINIPLGSGTHAPTLSASLARDSQQLTQEQVTINGTAGRNNQYNYGATTSHDSGTGSTATSINGGYRGPYAVVSASAGHGSGYSQSSLTVSGAVVAHPGGVTFGQPIGDTVGVIDAPHAKGARVNNSAGARVDKHGFALVPYLTPYTYNDVGLDPRNLPLDVQLDATSTRVAPRAGAVVMIPFQTQYGRSLIVQSRLADGKPLPFGASVTDAKGQSLGLVGQGGQMLIRGIADHGQVHVHWTDSDGHERSCGFSYTVPGDSSDQAYPSIDTVCRPSTPVNGGRQS